MKKVSKLVMMASIAVLCACSSSRATTAEEFVKKHSKAYYFRDAKAVARMTLCAEDLDLVALPPMTELEINELKRDSLVKNLKRDMKRDDAWGKGWEDTRYVGEEDHAYFKKVEVKVGYTYSSIVLVRVGKYLKIAPNPSSFE